MRPSNLRPHVAFWAFSLALASCPADRAPPISDGPLPPAAFGARSPAERAAREALDREASAARWKQRQAALAGYADVSADILYTRGLEAKAAQNTKDAADHFTAFVVHHFDDARVVDALAHAMRGRFALIEYDEGFNLAHDVLRRVDDVRLQARIHRMVGNTYLSVPHWGMTRGGEFLRGQKGQGWNTASYRSDRARAIGHLEKARALMLAHAVPPTAEEERAAEESSLSGDGPALEGPSTAEAPRPSSGEQKDGGLPADGQKASGSSWGVAKTFRSGVAPLSDSERVATLLELAAAVAQFTPYDTSWRPWWYAWTASEGDGLEDEEGADQQAGRSRYRGQLPRRPPKGLPVTRDGQIVFAPVPSAYAADLDDVSKIKYLLTEVRRTDKTKRKAPSARALLLQALLFHARDGIERLSDLRDWSWKGRYPFKRDVETTEVHTLEDDEVVGLVATHLTRFRVPPEESVPALLTRLTESYPDTRAGQEGLWLLGQFFQSRQQYDKARTAYRRYLTNYPTGTWTSNVRDALEVLDRQRAVVLWSGSQPAGRNAMLNLRFRNLSSVEFKVRPVDLDAISRDFRRAWDKNDHDYSAKAIHPNDLGYALVRRDDWLTRRYAPKVSQSFRRRLNPDPEGRYVEARIETPLSQPGTYRIDVYSDEGDAPVCSGLVVIEKLAVISKLDDRGPVLWVVDATTGRPVKGATVERLAYWRDARDGRTRRSRLSTTKTRANGLARVAVGVRAQHPAMTTVRGGGSLTMLGWSYYYGNYRAGKRYDNRTLALVMSDRPVYRPGDEVSLKVWVRKKNRGQYQPAADIKWLSIDVHDPQFKPLLRKPIKTDGWASGHVSFTLPTDAALGTYRVKVAADGAHAVSDGAQFRVEAYKAPEFTVQVKAAGQVRLGDTVDAEIQADYLFGGGVAGGRVTYRVYREEYDHLMLAPGSWDWLYGPGYGRCYYDYSWLSWWSQYGPHPWVWYPWWGSRPTEPRTLVTEGQGTLDSDGRLKVAIDTSEARAKLSERDHRYTVVAEVTDLSRRLIKGSGEVIATRHAFFANIENEAGYGWVRQAVRLALTTQRPDGEPLAVDGIVRIETIPARDSGATEPDTLVDELPVKTSTLGVTRVSWQPERAGQYRFTFVARDAWDNEVKKSTVAWVIGPEWNGRQYRFNGLEVLTDKRVYKPGDTARLLVNVNRPGASVLLATKLDGGVLLDYAVLDVEHKSRVIDVPITKTHIPNFFIEATTVADGQLFEEVREIFVPPQTAQLNVSVTTATGKTTFGPAEPVELKVKTTDLEGKPVPADVAVSVFDSSVLYIQPELTPDVREYFWAQKRSHNVRSTSSLTRTLSWSQNLDRPDREAWTGLSVATTAFFQSEIVWQRVGQSTGGELSSSVVLGGRPSESPLSRIFIPPPGASAPMGRGWAAPAAKGAHEANAVGRADVSPPAVSRSSQRARRTFADTAHFAPVVRTGARGEATVAFRLPDNLTTWKVKAIGLTADTRAGQSSASLRTTKKLLVRPQAPRFFRERDRVMLSAVVRNGYEDVKQVDVAIDVSQDLLRVKSDERVTVTVPPNGDARVDFDVEVIGEGQARVRMDAVSDVESDAKEQTFPVLVHGMTKTVSQLGSIRPAGPDEKTITLDIPEARRKHSSRLEVRWSPTLAGGMMDALPYLLAYPYGCTEQTLSRFVPAVLTRRALQQAGGLTLESLADSTQTNLNPQSLTEDGKRDPTRVKRTQARLGRSPVFDTSTLNDIIKDGLRRLASMQNHDGGWGWWGHDRSTRYMTAHVVAGLLDAESADLAFDESMLRRGQGALVSLVARSLSLYEKHDQVSNEDAYAAWVLARSGRKNGQLLDDLWARRANLSAYGKLLAALAFHIHHDADKANMLLRNAEQILVEDDENETAWLETRKEGGRWWYWYNDAIEANALYLRALDTMRPGSEAAPRVVKWLLNHRKNGYYWRSTRDTAAAIAALANHMQQSGSGRPDYDLDILLDGQVVKTVHIDETNLYTYDNTLVLEGEALTSGQHALTFRRRGNGAVYFNSYLSYFTTEEDIKKAGLEVKVERNYYKLTRRDRVRTMQDDRGQPLTTTEVAYAPTPLGSGDDVKSGDLLLVELLLTSKNDYTFLAIEDPKPAGVEPVALKSGVTYGEAVANMELRDEKVVFFLRRLTRGKLRLTYRVRAEIPGAFHAMPTVGFGMYAPEIRANSDEMRLVIDD